MVPVIAVKLPVDHFVRPVRPILESWSILVPATNTNHHQKSGRAGLIRRRVFDVSSAGPGIISMIVSVSIAEFPGKHRLEHWFINNWIETASVP